MILLAIALTQTPIQECRWKKCGHEMGKLVRCEPEERGTQQELALIVAMTKKGAVTWECRPDVDSK